MAIRYYIDLDCTPRQQLGGENLAEMIRLRDLAEFAASEHGGKLPPEAELDLRVKDPEGGEEGRKLTIAAIREETAPLKALAAACEGCPASLTGEPYGCHGAVFFPISTKAEYWLLAQMAAEGTIARKQLLDLLAEHGEEIAAPMRNWRAAGLFESGAAAKLPDEEFAITGDMAFGLLFSREEIDPYEGLQLLLMFDALTTPEQKRGDELAQALTAFINGEEDAAAPELAFGLSTEPSDDDSTNELTQFFLALYAALSLQANVVVRG